MIASDDSVNVNELLDAISDDEDVMFNLYKNWDYSHITYKQMMSEILFPRKYVTIREIISLIHERVDNVIDNHVYYSKH